MCHKPKEKPGRQRSSDVSPVPLSTLTYKTEIKMKAMAVIQYLPAHLCNARQKLGIKAGTAVTTGSSQAGNPSQDPHNFPWPNVFFFHFGFFSEHFFFPT